MDANRRDEHTVLGVRQGASLTEIRAAFRNMARRHHPDLNPDPAAAARFARIRTAYETLSAGAAPGRGRNRREYGPEPAAGRGRAPRRARRAGQRRRNGAGAHPAVLDRFGRVWMTLDDAWTGGLCRVTLDPPIQPRRHLVRIPPGIADGQVIRLASHGRRGTDGSKGDLYLAVRLTPHPGFRVDGRDVGVGIPVAPWEAVLGARVPVRTPAGRVGVRIPPGCSSGRRLCLPGRGLPNPHGGDAGDLVVTVRITVPKQLSRVDRMLFERLAETSDFDARRLAERRIA